MNPPKLGGNLSLDTHRPWPLFAIGRSSNLGEDGLGSGTKTVGGKTSTTNPLWANQFLPWREAYSADPLFRRSAVPLLRDTTVTQILHYPFPAPLLSYTAAPTWRCFLTTSKEFRWTTPNHWHVQLMVDFVVKSHLPKMKTKKKNVHSLIMNLFKLLCNCCCHWCWCDRIGLLLYFFILLFPSSLFFLFGKSLLLEDMYCLCKTAVAFLEGCVKVSNSF